MARIGLFEDDKAYSRMYGMYAELNGHEVVVRADTLHGALDVIHQAAEGRLDPMPDAWVIDGNLQRGTAEGIDGRTILRALGELGVEGVRIGNSSFAWHDFDQEMQPDFDAQKDPNRAMEYLSQREQLED